MNRKNDKKSGITIGEMNVTGGNVNMLGEGTFNQINNATPDSGVSRQALLELLNQISSLVEKENISRDIKQVIRGDLQSAIQQTQNKHPEKSLILNRLKSLSDLIISLGGAVSAGETIYPLIQQAIQFAQKLVAG